MFGLFTNVIWDAQLHFKDVFFENMLDWLFTSIEHFLKNPEQTLIIRIHPAEVTGTVPSRQPVLKEIQSRFGELPSNIEVIEPDNDLTSYDVIQRIDYALVFGSKMAVEIAAGGTPVVICGDSWARGKGFSVDAVSRDHYGDILKSPQSHVRLPRNFSQLAKQYAYYLFFGKMIEVGVVGRAKRLGRFALRLKNLDAIVSDRGLQTIVDSILHNSEFNTLRHPET